MENSLFLDILASLQRLFVGYIPAAVLGSFIGYLISINDAAYQVLKRFFEIPNSLPPVALLPIMLITFSERESALVIVIFIATLWSIVVNVAIGIRHFHRQGNNFRVAIFHAFHALRVGIWVAWFTVIAIEMLTGQRGLGTLAWNAYKSVNIDYILETTLYIWIIGVLLDQLLDFTGYILSQMVSDGKKSS